MCTYSSPRGRTCALRVQVNNQEAIDFYRKFGFAVGDVMKDYYKKIEPPDAVVLSKKLK